MSCPYCGEDHLANQHGALGLKLYWWEEEHHFRTPADTWHGGTKVILTADEVRQAEERASKIVDEDIERGYQMYFQPGSGESRYDVNLRGFGAEIAAEHATGLKKDWRYLPKRYRKKNKRPDLGRRVEVRDILWKGGDLVAYENDPTSRVFLAVQGKVPVFIVCGWVEGIDLMLPENWREPPEVKHAGYFMFIGDLNRLPLPNDA